MSFSLRYFQDKQSSKTGNDAAQQKTADDYKTYFFSSLMNSDSKHVFRYEFTV